MFDRRAARLRRWRGPFGLTVATFLLLAALGLGLLPAASVTGATTTFAALPAADSPVNAYAGAWTTGATGDVPTFDQLGTGWARIAVAWADIEPASNVFGWDGLDAQVNAASGGGKRQVLVMVRDNPAWAAASRCKITSEAERTRLASFMTALVTRYKGRVSYWQLYNEMDNTSEAFDQQYDLGGCFGTASGTTATQAGRDSYALMLEAVGAAIHTADPTAKVVHGPVVSGSFVVPECPTCIFDGGFAQGVLARLKADGMLDRVDVMSTHYFSSQAAYWAPSGPDLLGRITKFRQDMRDVGLSEAQVKPILVDEGSYTDATGTSTADPNSAFNVGQRNYVVKALTRAAAANVTAYFWFWLRDTGGNGLGTDNAYGLLTPDGSPKPSYTAMRYFLSLVDRQDRLVGRLTFASPKLEGYELLTADGRHVQVVWNEADAENVAYSPPGTILAVAGSTGASIPFSNNGTSIGSEPRYVTYTPRPATSTATATLAPTGTPAPGQTPSPTPLPVVCTPRPPVNVAVNPSGSDRLQVTVSVNGQNNRVVSLDFGSATNGRIDVGGQTGIAGDTTFTVPTTSTQVTFTIRRAAAGSVTVPLTVVDRCGEWQTFVGGGTGAF